MITQPVATFTYVNVDLTHHICRLKPLAAKISDPHLPVCAGGATRLEVCMLIGVIKSQKTITEVCICCRCSQVIGGVHSAYLMPWWSSSRLYCRQTPPAQRWRRYPTSRQAQLLNPFQPVSMTACFSGTRHRGMTRMGTEQHSLTWTPAPSAMLLAS